MTTPESKPRVAVRMKGIRKAFKAVVANQNVDLEIEEGEIHALLGENGAGKTTLMNILYGLYHQDEGTVEVFGEALKNHSPGKAVRMGIGMVHQHFMLIPPFTVLQNIMLGIEESNGPFLDSSKLEAQIRELGDKYGLKIDLDARVEDLSVSQQQRVEILKVLVRGARILILDEPTAVLTPQEVQEFFQVLRTLKAQGATFVIITHKLKEVKALADRLTVMRGGATIATRPVGNITENEIAEMMVGRPVRFELPRSAAKPGAMRLEVKDLSGTVDGRKVLDGLNLEIRSGEILGLAGVAGNGQTELILSLVGLLPEAEGTIKIDGTEVTKLSVRDRMEKGLAHICEDRLKHAIVPDFPVEDNMMLGLHHKGPYSSMGLIDHGHVRETAIKLGQEFDVRPFAPDIPIRQLSGGNQQKVVIARECTKTPRVLIAALPTRGVDIGAIEFIHQRILTLRGEGVAVLLVSSELSEILSLSDRIAVLYRGRIFKTFEDGQATEAALGLAMAGVN